MFCKVKSWLILILAKNWRMENWYIVLNVPAFYLCSETLTCRQFLPTITWEYLGLGISTEQGFYLAVEHFNWCDCVEYIDIVLAYLRHILWLWVCLLTMDLEAWTSKIQMFLENISEPVQVKLLILISNCHIYDLIN